MVEVSPSTEIWLKVAGTTWDRAFCSTSWERAASVVMKSSMVAMLGWIMPPMVNSTAACLGWVSVVMMAVAAARLPAGVLSSLEAASGTPAWKGSMLMAWPMTPVEAGSTSASATPRAWAVRAQTSLASWTPFGAQVLALPLLTTMAWA